MDNLLQSLGGAIAFAQTNMWANLLLLLWTIPWKGVALWKAARKKQSYWFVALLIINTLGILEILYMFVFSKMGEKKPEAKEEKPEEKE